MWLTAPSMGLCWFWHGFVLSDAPVMSRFARKESAPTRMQCMCVFGVQCVFWVGGCLVNVSALLHFVCLWYMFGASFMDICVLFNVSCRVSTVVVGLHLALLAVLLSGCVPIGAMF